MVLAGRAWVEDWAALYTLDGSSAFDSQSVYVALKRKPNPYYTTHIAQPFLTRLPIPPFGIKNKIKTKNNKMIKWKKKSAWKNSMQIYTTESLMLF